MRRAPDVYKRQYLIGAGVRREANPAQHDLIVQAMTLQMYDARGADTPQMCIRDRDSLGYSYLLEA